jgi:hypothetical protein
MANYGPSDFKITYDSTDITQYCMTINDGAIEQAVEEVHSLGDAWEEYLPVGVGKVAPIEIGGLYDDTASTGPDALFKITTPAGPATPRRRGRDLRSDHDRERSQDALRAQVRSQRDNYGRRLTPTGQPGRRLSRWLLPTSARTTSTLRSDRRGRREPERVPLYGEAQLEQWRNRRAPRVSRPHDRANDRRQGRRRHEQPPDERPGVSGLAYNASTVVTVSA